MKEMSKHLSFHGTISREEAELILKKHGGNCSLTRYSNGTHVLSVMDITNEDRPVLQHFKLCIHATNKSVCCEIDGSGKKFGDVSKMLDFYKDHSINYAITSVGALIKAGRPSLMRTDTDGKSYDFPNGDAVEVLFEGASKVSFTGV